MPVLTYTISDSRRGGVLNSRVLIGRRLSHGVVLDDPGVSRLHAWIDPIADENAQWILTDAGSKTGTFVNDQRITRHPLVDGDQIRVGHVTLRYHDRESVPDGASVVELSSPSGVVRTAGILFECACGAPLWVGNELAGKRGICRHCRQPVTVPEIKPESVAPKPLSTTAPVIENQPALPVSVPQPASGKKLSRCAVCHSDIVEGEEQTQCPDCAMHYHAECWEENLGCSSYGCPQVNALQPAGESDLKVLSQNDSPRRTPWEPILLAASVVGSFLGAPAFGSVAAVVAIFAGIVLFKGKAVRAGLLIGAMLVSLIGIAIGLGVSDLIYFNARHWPELLRQHLQ